MSQKRVVVRLTPEEKSMLRELAEKNQTSMTEMIRRLIDEEYEKRWPEEADAEVDSLQGERTAGRSPSRARYGNG